MNLTSTERPKVIFTLARHAKHTRLRDVRTRREDRVCLVAQRAPLRLRDHVLRLTDQHLSRNMQPIAQPANHVEG
jgi:hypothetical protein